MKRDIVKLILFLLPLTIIPFINYTVDTYYVFGRSKQMEEITDTLLAGKSITGVENFNDRYLQKLLIRKMKKTPDVISLGSSQTMPLRTSYLGLSSGSFFNHSVAAGNLHDMIAILGCYKKMRGGLPKNIIIGVSLLFFNKAETVPFFSKRWQIMRSEYNYLLPLIKKKNPAKFEFIQRAEDAIQEYKLLFSSSYALTNLKKINGLFKDNRLFRVIDDEPGDCAILSSDGSFHFYFKHDDAETLRRTDNYINSAIKRQNHKIINMKLFANLVDYILSCGSQVIFYLPPCNLMLYNELLTNKKLLVFRESEKQVLEIAISRHIPIYGSYDPTILGLQNKNFWDAWHTHDFTVKKIFTGFTLSTDQTGP